ncbi:MAG: hypothetical protein M0R73_08440 [Dehalococcoidia bacterium]|nr:hypothetical protein [Dehalococcoidia bacterium]
MSPSTPTDEIARLEDIPVPEEGPLAPLQGVMALRRALQAGEPWYDALLRVIARWTAPTEEVDGVRLHYLVAGEAFDWLLLAQRLLAAMEDLAPAEEVEALLVQGIPPRPEGEEEFEAAIGPAKYRAHLNFQYGVVVEELLLLSAEMELQKHGTLSRLGTRGAEVEAYERVYGKTLEELKVLYQGEEGIPLGDQITQTELRAFTYWLSKFRIRHAEPARIASDTRKAMTVLARMEGNRTRMARLRAAAERRGALG